MAGTRNSTTQAVRKAFRLLQCFGASDVTSLGVTELSALTGWTQSTVSRLLSALQESGFVQQDVATGRYRLGLQLITLAGAALTSRALYSIGHPHLERLAAASGETANLCILDGDRVLCIDEVEGIHPIKLSGWIGMRLPLHATAAGKVLLAALPQERRAALLAPGLTGLTPHTLTDQERLVDELERALAQGYALNMEEMSEGLTALAAPVRNHTGQVVAALTVAGPSFRLRDEHLDACIIMVKDAAAAISRALGHRAAVA